MIQPGAPAALEGYDCQALYTLTRIFAPGMDGARLFQPEDIEDLSILESDGTILEAIQVKSYASLALSDLEPGRKGSFFDRVLGLLESESPPAIRLVNFGRIGPELSGAWAGDETHRARVAAKLSDKGFTRLEVDKLFGHIELVPLNKDHVRKALLERIGDLPAGIDRANALDLFVAWYYRLAKRRQAVSCGDLIGKVNAVSRFLSERYHYHKQWHTTIEPLEVTPIEEERFSRLRDEFYAGVRARFEHIVAGLDFPRQHKIAEIVQAFEKSKVVIVHAASGQGKSTLAYRYVHDMYPDKWRFAVRRVQDVEQALSIALALSGFAKAVEVPICVYVDVHPRDTEWPELVSRLSNQPLLELLVTVREEDYRRADLSEIGFAELSLGFDQAEAELLYERAHGVSERWGFLDFDAAWDAFGGEGPLMEFVYLLTQTQTLEERLKSQVQRIEEEVRGLRASPDELRLLSLVAVTSAYGARLCTCDVIEALNLPAPDRTLRQFEQEYLLRRTAGGMNLEGLHPIRSEILGHLLIQPDANPWLETVAQVLPLTLEEDLETLILHALADEDHRADHEGFLDLVMALQPGTWSGVAGILRSLFWADAWQYVTNNRAVLDAASQELGSAWWLAVDLNFASPGESPELGTWWTSLGSLIPPERQAMISAIRADQTPKDALFQRSQEWLRSLTVLPAPPSAPEAWRAVAEVWYWVAKLAPDTPFGGWISGGEIDAPADKLPLTILADLSFSMYLCDPERHQRWLEAQRGILDGRLAHEQDVLALQQGDTTLKIHFIPSGAVAGDSSDPLHDETMAKIDLVRRLLPGYERYGAQGYAFKLAGIELPQGDSTRKDGIPATYLIPKWVVWLNAIVGGIARLCYRSDSWNAYLEIVVNARESIADRLDELNLGLSRFFQRTKPINVGLNCVDLQAWQRCWEQLSGTVDLPRTAVDPWGFASEEASSTYAQILDQQQYVPTAIALRRYKPYLDAQRAYFSSIRNFLGQAPDVWITNANAGKPQPRDPKRKAILEAVQQQGIKTDSYSSVYNLHESKIKLQVHQETFRALFGQYLDKAEIAALEKRESEILALTWPLWYFYAYAPWKRATNPRRQVPQWMDTARYELRMSIQHALTAIQTPECSAAVLDYDREYLDSPAWWLQIDLTNPTDLYSAALETVPAALANTLKDIEPKDLTYYLIQDTCQYLVIIPLVRGRMLDKLIWPFQTLTLLKAGDIQERPWAYFPQELVEDIRNELNLRVWDVPGVHTANQLSHSVATLRQLTSQIAEFQGMPDLTEPGLERRQTYVTEQLSEALNASLQMFFDAAEELVERFNVLPEGEQEKRSNLYTAVGTLLKVHELVRPGEGDGVFKLDLAETAAYSQRLKESYPAVEGIRLLWIADILDQID